VIGFALHALESPVFYLALGGVGAAWFLYVKRPDIPETIEQKFKALHTLLVNKYYFDDFNQTVFANGAVDIGKRLWKHSDQGLIDGLLVNGTAKTVGMAGRVVRHVQTGQLSHYAFAMIIGLVIFLGWLVY
ncbi:MAG: NADH-quinone oxidoreductase subunit L, partial [Gammaproteobacteria bacterium]